MKPSILMLTLDSPHIDRRILQEAQSLAQHGHQVTILSPAPLPERPGPNPLFVSLTKERGYTSPLAWLGLARRMLNAFPPAKRLAVFLYGLAAPSAKVLTRDFFNIGQSLEGDIVMAHDLPVLGVAGRLAAGRNGWLAYDAHEYYLSQGFLGSREMRDLSRMEREWIGRAALTITVNDDIARRFVETYGVTTPLVIHNSCPTVSAPANTPGLRERLGLAPDRRILLFQGAFHPRRNLLEVVRLAARLGPEFATVMLGWGEMEIALRREAQRLGVEGKQLFLVPKISQDELPGVTASADFGLIPYAPVDYNTQYCSPNKLYEFFQANLPVFYNQELVTTAAILKDIGGGVPLDFGNFDQAAATIQRIANDQQAIGDLRRGAAAAQLRYGWETQERSLIQAFDALVSKNVSAQ